MVDFAARQHNVFLQLALRHLPGHPDRYAQVAENLAGLPGDCLLGIGNRLLTLSYGQSAVRISPALSISKTEVDEGLQIFEGAVTVAEKEAGM